MKHLFTILLTLFSFYASGYAQKPFKVVFYNLENFFDLENDPLEAEDLSHNPEYRGALEWCRERRDYTINSTPAGQTGWAPIGDNRFAEIRSWADIGR